MSIERRCTMTTLSDFRGNLYRFGAALGVPCDESDCDAEAVRCPCNAEGDTNRTHWHGGIHRLDGGPGFQFCEQHGLEHLARNAEIAAAREKGGER